ncbi:uncharacterized protein LOC129314161 [Prosopis cineraria]|uniref:uncharacterized protein LOC129314161 n=1 Tax=Prosopis cineraria TaxID=364024 RepID=UPI00240EB986|nr:uncharacterized protein LOC129314161 [Prosopis cineraria]
MAKLGNEKIAWIVSVVFCFFLSLVLAMAAIGDGGSGKEHEVEKLLKKLNKPAVKSIKSPDGDIIDYVHILNQPAFDHPKLKNHKIQMRPTFHPKATNFSKSNPIAQMWYQSGNCPKGTVRLRRTTEDDVMRADSIKQYSKRRSLYSTEGHEYAVADLRGDRYYGGHASINIWKSLVQESNEFSLSQIWIVNDDDPINVETIEAGWQNDSYQTQCYNLNCQPGFVLVDKKVAVTSSLELSVYDGSQNELSILIWKDPETGNWWMQVGDTSTGYWPASLVNRMSESASNVKWGGEIINLRSDGQHTTTGMGSGYFPEEGYGKASFFKELSIVDANNNLVSPTNPNISVTNPNCYNITFYGYSHDWGVYFYYGGPGRNQNCP